MAYNNYSKVFADESVGINGLLYKAGLTELTSTVQGLGIGHDGNSWFTPTNATIVNGGVRESLAGQILCPFPDAAGRYSNIRQAFMQRGAIQVKLHLNDVFTGSVLGASIIEGFNLAVGIGFPVLFRTNILSTPVYNSFNELVTDANGNAIFNEVCVAKTGSQIYDVEESNMVLHSGLGDADGYFTLGIDWAGNVQREFINGIHVINRYIDTYDNEFNQFAFQRANNQTSMKELLIFDRPFERQNKSSELMRIALIGHSYVDRQHLNRQYYDNGVIGGRTSAYRAYSTLEGLNSSISQNINAEVEILSTGYSGQTLAYQESRIINGTATAFVSGTGNDQDQVKRYLPHFCVIFGSSVNDRGTAQLTLETSVYNISTDLMANGIIPIWACEWDRIGLDSNVEQGYVVAEVTRQQASNDMGLIDGIAEFGASPDLTLSSYEVSTGRHPNAKGQALWGALIAAEIDRLILNPPSYSRLAGGDGSYRAISAPT